MVIGMETIWSLPRLYVSQSLVEAGRSIAKFSEQWRRRRRERASLARLDDRLLADIGLSRVDQDRECNKPFWRA